MTFSPDGELLATGGWDGVVKLWELPRGVRKRQFAGSQRATERAVPAARESARF